MASPGVSYIEVRARLDKLESDLKRMEATAKDSGTKAGKAIETGLESKLQKTQATASRVSSKMKYATGIIGAGFVYAANKASDLSEAMNVTGLVFGDASDKIGEFAENAATAIGQSERAAREATAQIGGLLKNLGFAQDETVQWSMDLTVLASDLASAFNTDPADAVQALGSALRGETEPIRRYNVMLDDATVRQTAVEMGLAATTAEVDKNGKAQAALSLIMKQTSDVHGDFANTAEGAANAQRIAAAQAENAAASLGESLAPIMGKVAQLAGNVAEKFASMSDGMQTGTIVGLALIAVIGPLASAISAVSGAWLWYIRRTKLATVATNTSVVSMTRLEVAAGTAAVNVGRLGLALKAISGAAIGYAALEVVKRLGDKAEDTGTKIDDMVMGLVQDNPIVRAGLWGKGIVDGLLGIEDEAEESEVAMDGWVSGATKMADTAKKTGDKVKDAGKDAETATHGFKKFFETGKDFETWKDSSKSALTDLSGAFGKLSDDAKVTAGELIEAFEKQREAASNFKENLQVLISRGAKPNLIKDLVEMGDEGAQWAQALVDANEETTKAFFYTRREAGKELDSLTNQVRTADKNIGSDLDNIGRKTKANSASWSDWERKSRDSISGVSDDLEALWRLVKQGVTAPGTVRAEAQGMGDPSAAGQFGTPTARAMQAMAAVAGFQAITSGYRPGDTGSFHAVPPPNNAVDIGGENLAAVFSYIAANYGKQARELIYGHAIIEHGRMGYYAPNDHWDHVHFADMGAIVKGPAMIAQGNITEAHIPLSGPGAKGMVLEGQIQITNWATGDARLRGVLKQRDHQNARVNRTLANR